MTNILLVIIMIHGLNYDEQDPNYKLLNKIFKIIDSRSTDNILARNDFKNLKRFKTAVKTIFLASFFENDISFTVNQLNSKSKLIEGLNFEMVLTAQEVYTEISDCNKDNLENAVNSILKKLNKKVKTPNRTFLIDATPGDVDVNFRSKKITKKSLENKDYKWAWGTALGSYLGFKITLVLDYDNLMPVLFLLSRGSPHDTKMVPIILKELKRRKIISHGDKLLFDRGYYAYNNYKLALEEYKVIPLILVKGKLNIKKINSIFSYPLDCYFNKKNTSKLKRKYKTLVDSLMSNIMNKKVIKYQRSHIEDYFKLLKEGLGFKHLHKYTFNSMHKATSLIVLLSGIIIHYCVDTKQDFQRLAEGTFF